MEEPGRELLDRAMRRACGAPLRSGNRLELLRDGPATYDSWLAAIEGARRWVHLENYIFSDDGVGRRFAEALSRKAREGVAVRVLYDWFGCLDVRSSFWEGLRRAGVEACPVNAPSLREPRDLLPRDHRKLLAVDGEYASVGGVCLSEGWLERSPKTGLPYRDTCVAVRGPAVADAERAFAGVWDLFARRPLPPEERPGPGEVPGAGEVAARVVAQEPGRARMLRALELLLASVRERVWISDPYFLGSPVLTQALVSAAADGVDVRLLLPATNDLPWIGALSRIGYRPLLEAGVRIFEYGGPMMHAKTHVADSFHSRVGSTNLNFSGLLANWEADLLAEDAGFAARMEEMFEEDFSNAREILLHRGRRPRPQRPMSRSERRDRRRTMRRVRRGSGGTASRIGEEALHSATFSPASYERRVKGALSAGLLALSVLGARHPRLISWPLAAAGAAAGVLGLLRALRGGGP
ncbi:Phospholipase D/Transphosphatidylase [Rubrobacter xylanophilus DSM 9941]|uniref:Phospholipase D/Transphosphatidylase n=1 Tax=Rubrobacter xylanophilus (strain DSM 9941 / JCM 11954 / NBRC 16129 / PRD-1) TaxID=266117 RepID=Q1AY79_RUBXD|nr:phospholipase D-like domain-containing protein [Rubrobacter xylanophilus]ABG03649.1 Phospholipase D/Transphosphatidylase [Rubrobacter xylanophilus DSM 9941]